MRLVIGAALVACPRRRVAPNPCARSEDVLRGPDDRHPNDPTDHGPPRPPVLRQEAIDPVAGRSSPRAPCGCHMNPRSRTVLGLLLVALVTTLACTRRPGGGTRVTADVDSGPLVPLAVDPEPVTISPAPALPSAPAPMTSTSLAMGTTTPWVDATRSSHATTAVRAFGSLVRVADLEADAGAGAWPQTRYVLAAPGGEHVLVTGLGAHSSSTGPARVRAIFPRQSNLIALTSGSFFYSEDQVSGREGRPARSTSRAGSSVRYGRFISSMAVRSSSIRSQSSVTTRVADGPKSTSWVGNRCRWAKDRLHHQARGRAHDALGHRRCRCDIP